MLIRGWTKSKINVLGPWSVVLSRHMFTASHFQISATALCATACVGDLVHLPLYLYLCLSLPKPICPVPVVFGLFRGSDNPPVAIARAWHPPPKKFQNQSKIVFFLNPFSNAFLDRFLVHFASQLASQNPLKCVKNRCQDAFHLGLHVWIDFWLIFAPNLDPLNPIWH